MLPDELQRGYAHFRAGRYETEAQRYEELARAGQQPKIMVIACCDSRAAPEMVFGARPGELFVVRNVANLVPPYAPDGRHHSTSAALEFAVLQLEVRHIVVMGHGRCGGIAAVLGDAAPLSRGDFIGSWMASVRDVAELVPADLPQAERQMRVERVAIEHSLANLRTFPWLRGREEQGKLALHGAWFDIASGELAAYDEQGRTWAPVEARSAEAII